MAYIYTHATTKWDFGINLYFILCSHAKNRFILLILNFNYSSSFDIKQTLYAEEVAQQY